MPGTVKETIEQHPHRPKQMHALRDLHRDLKNEGQDMLKQIEAAGREPTEKEENRFQYLAAEIEKCSEAIQQEEERLDAERMATPSTDGSSAGTTAWRDAQGNPVALLTNSQTLRSVRPQSGYGDQSGFEQNVSAGDFIRGIVTGSWPAGIGAQSAHSGGKDTAGGYLLSPFMSRDLIDLARNRSVLIRAGARTLEMPTSEMAIVKVTKDPELSWTAENQSLPFSESAFGRLTFRAKKMGTIVKLSQELVEDAPNASEIIQNQLSQQLALEMDRAGLLGNAYGEEPRGIFYHPDVQEEDVSGAIDYDSFLDAIQKVEDVNGVPNAAIYSPSTKKALAKLKTSEGDYLNPPQDFQDLRRLATKQLGNSQAATGDFTQIIFGVRIGVQIEVSRVAGDSFRDDQVWIRARWRGDIQIARPSHLVRLTNISAA